MKTLDTNPQIANGDALDATVVMDRINRVRTLINTTKLDLDNLNGPSPALIALTNGSAIPTWTALSGDATITSAGVLTFGTQVTHGQASSNLTLTPTPQAIPGISINAVKAGLYLCIATFDFEMVGIGAATGPQRCTGELTINTVAATGVAGLSHGFTLGSTDEIARASVSQTWVQSITAGQTIALRASALTTVAATPKAIQDNTSLSVARLGT